MLATLLTLGSMGMNAVGQIQAGRAAKKAAASNAETALDVGKMNANLIVEGSELNAEQDEFNARSFEGAATDAITRGKETERKFRTQIKGLIGSQRANYAAQGIDVADGSALEVQADTAKQGEFDALTIRTNAAREAWGYKVQAKGSYLRAGATRKLGKLQSSNIRDVSRAQANNYIAGGNAAASQANWGAASTIATGALQMYAARK